MSALTITDDYVQAGYDGIVFCSVCQTSEKVDGPYTTNQDKWGPFQHAQEHARNHGASTQCDSSAQGARFQIIVVG